VRVVLRSSRDNGSMPVSIFRIGVGASQVKERLDDGPKPGCSEEDQNGEDKTKRHGPKDIALDEQAVRRPALKRLVIPSDLAGED